MSHADPSSFCPDLDFSDCLPTPLSPSPRQRRPRGAPWASERPRPFVDRPNTYEQESDTDLDTATLEQQQRTDCIVPDLQHSPLKRRAIHQICDIELQETRRIHSKDSDELLHLLFPEVCRVQDSDVQQSAQASNIKHSVVAHDSSEFPETRDEDNQVNEVRYNRFYEASHPPVTPERLSSQHASNEQNIQISRTNTRSTFKTKFTYSSKKTNKSILRSAAIREFEGITGVTTSSRIKAASTHQTASESESEEEVRSRHHIADSPRQESIPNSSKSIHRLSDSLQHHLKVNHVSSRHIYNGADSDTIAPQHQLDGLNSSVNSRAEFNLRITQTRASARRAKRRKNQFSDNLAGPSSCKPPRSTYLRRNLLSQSAPASSSSYQAEHQDDRADDLKGPTDVAAKHEKYKQYVYEQLLDYQPRHYEEDDLRPGYRRLEMGYLIPPPSGHFHDDRFYQDSQDDENIHELRLMILGRISQTEFKSIQAEVARTRKHKTRTSRRKIVQEEENQLHESEDDKSKSERKKPLSRLNMHTVVNNQTLPAEVAAIDQVRKEIHTKTKTIGQTLRKGKRSLKKMQPYPGHLPLQLKYSREKTSIRDVTEDNSHEDDHESVHPADEERQIASQPRYPAREPTLENVVIQEIVQATSATPEVPPANTKMPTHHHPSGSRNLQRVVIPQKLVKSPSTLPVPPHVNTATEDALSLRPNEEKDLDLCDILMPMSPQTRRPSSFRPFTLRTTNTTRHAYASIRDPSMLQATRVDNESFLGLPSALWYGETENEHESQDKYEHKINASYLETDGSGEVTSYTSNERTILALGSSNISDKQQIMSAASKGLRMTENQYSQHGSSEQYPLVTNDEDQVPATAGSIREQSSCLSHWDDAVEEYPSPSYQSVSSEDFDYDGPTPPLEEAYSYGILMPNNLPSSALPAPRDSIPAGHQQCYTPSSDFWQQCYTPSSDYWPECTERMWTVPSDIEREFHEYPEEYQPDYIALPLKNIPSPQPAPATPEEDFNGVEMTLQTKLGAYGRRIVEVEPPYTTRRDRFLKRTILQESTPPENQQALQTARLNTVTDNDCRTGAA